MSYGTVLCSMQIFNTHKSLCNHFIAGMFIFSRLWLKSW